MMIHLTLTGPMAGAPICGGHRNDDDQYSHAVYTPVDKLRDKICPACLAVWDDSDVQPEYHVEATMFGYHAWVDCDGITVATEHFDKSDYANVADCYDAVDAWLKDQGSK